MGWKSRSGVAAVAIAALLLAACGNGSSAASSSPVPKAGTIGTDHVSGLGAVLDDSAGLTLYHLTTENGGTIRCTGSCAETWPPVIVTGSLPIGSAVITGTFGTVERPGGTKQLTYDGMPLYTYTGDSGPGEANGQGIQGVWFAVTPSGSSDATGAGSASGSSGGSGW